jgi:predicted lysophospholipase L1 biosynthesis ABC-type transport system permease subunit
VQRFFAGADPVGQRFSVGDGGMPGAYEIVGLVENAKYDDPRDRVRPMAFLALLQPDPDEDPGTDQHHVVHTIAIRASGNPATVAGSVRAALAEIDPDLLVLRVDTLSDQVDRALSTEKVVANLAAFFGVVALALTCVGLYGLTAWSVQRRTREIGIRIALGARRDSVIAMVIREVLRQAAIGAVVGIPAAFIALTVIRSALYGVSPADLQHSAIAALILVGCMLAAGFVPARRASRIEPIEALRHE